MPDRSDGFVPALRFDVLTGLYDWTVRLTLPEARFRAALLRQAGLAAGQHVLDLGCGTGALALRASQAMPEAKVLGLDRDPKILAIAATKARAAGLDVLFQEGDATELPLPAESVERVLSGLFFHHLTAAQKAAALGEVFRVLKPGGELHVADWGRARGPLLRAAFVAVQILDGFANTADNVAGRLPAMMRAAGFEEVRETRHFATALGSLWLYCARKPQTP